MTDSFSSMIPYTEAQRREAADWFVLIRTDEDLQTETVQTWLRWMDQNESNRVAFESVAQAWHATPGISALAMPSAEELLADSYDGDLSIDEWRTNQPVASGVAASPERHGTDYSKFARRWTWLAAASLVAVTLGLFTMNRYLDLRGSQSDEFTTKTSEQIEITLADGSRVWLGPRSRLLVGFSKERRDIQLAAGEAFFSVKKDRSRPFTVRSSSGDITAVGTAFNVRALDNHVTVAVSEGVVTVAPKTLLSNHEPPTVRVASGQQVTFTAEESIKAIAITQSPSPGERARWRDGVLVYRDEPLRDVVMDVVRYSDRRIEISDEAIGDLHYSGVVYRGAVEEWTHALPESFPVRIITQGNREIIEAR
jgi:transmembrane sensor